MQENSPYATPAADITTQNADETYQPQVFATKGRIGRLRYLAYTFGSYALVGVIVAVFMAVGLADTASESMVSMIAILVMYAGMIAFGVILSKRRLNDLDKTGWLVLALFIPIVGAFFGLYMMFASGTDGSNKYGLAPCENPVGVKIIGLIFPIVFIIGIVAAIALPA